MSERIRCVREHIIEVITPRGITDRGAGRPLNVCDCTKCSDENKEVIRFRELRAYGSTYLYHFLLKNKLNVELAFQVQWNCIWGSYAYQDV